MGKRKLSNGPGRKKKSKKSDSIENELNTTNFHLFSKTKAEIAKNKKITKFFSKEIISPSPSLSAYERTLIMMIAMKQEKFIFYVNYFNNSLSFPILSIKSFLTSSEKEKLFLYFKTKSLLSFIICGFSQKKLITTSSNMFNFITMFKIDSKIALLNNKIYEGESLLLCDPRQCFNFDINCEFIIIKVKTSVIEYSEIDSVETFSVRGKKQEENGLPFLPEDNKENFSILINV